MLSGSTFRRNGSNTHMQSPTDLGSARNIGNTQVQSPVGRGPNRNSTQSWSSRYSSSTTTPTRFSFADQRWSPRNAPPEPQTGVFWEDVVRQSPRHESTIDRMISDLNSSDDSKENRPPPDHYD
jgi:hypothetical protein